MDLDDIQDVSYTQCPETDCKRVIFNAFLVDSCLFSQISAMRLLESGNLSTSVFGLNVSFDGITSGEGIGISDHRDAFPLTVSYSDGSNIVGGFSVNHFLVIQAVVFLNERDCDSRYYDKNLKLLPNDNPSFIDSSEFLRVSPTK